ncbi:MFS transporter [Paraburkholderia sp. CNPSo 3272]|uniref:MFS transporter n=1 Tax=Paraburkholderia sp. CNPSo 3272 TaxID=2940931 RepID=UPI0020B90263|nr:MFS transporter [Paraburkholderia sp. CNPSo 3272]MCP3725321.1 MFS transporter [Paraburkholderia sp. CNPSo 3272]
MVRLCRVRISGNPADSPVLSEWRPGDCVDEDLRGVRRRLCIQAARRRLLRRGGRPVGRKKTLALTILIMAGATTVIGFLPTYASVGMLAPLLLAIVRCVQGFSAGGEYAGACAYLMEHAPKHQRARYGSFLPVSTFLSFASAAVVASGLDAVLSPEAMSHWGWRIPFIAAAPIGLVGLYLRTRLGETPSFAAVEHDYELAHAPLRETLKTQAGAIVRLGAFVSVTALSFYTAIAGACMLALGAVLSGVVTAALLSEIFPTRTRYTASAITYNLAYTIFGGTAPLVATWLIESTGNSISPAYYLIAVSLLALVGGMSLPETSRISLDDHAHEGATERVAAGGLQDAPQNSL